MKTRQEIIYEFMVAISSNAQLAEQCYDKEEFVDHIYKTSELLADKVFEKLLRRGI